ncbi:hypothetical protein BKA61DRAFT_709750 [Leptodontidium sp. MPI-SDFR-AT-0119]|nr:hypothetical protein BKA61DRAFT_709750 [Leptodontidium sp. MPI-SDFR-AT-0119]
MASSSQDAMAPETTSRQPMVEDELPEDTKMPDPPEHPPAPNHPRRSENSYRTIKQITDTNSKDYYGILGLEKTCTPDEIKEQYKKLSKLTHPDKTDWLDAGLAFQRLSTAHDVLKDPSERRSYDKAPERYSPPERPFGEEFGPNAFDGDDSGSDLSDVSDDEVSTTLKPNEAIKAIYRAATPLIQGILDDPPSAREKPMLMEEVNKFNDQIKAQNKKDGLDDKNLGQFLIQYTIFESNALLARPHWEKLKKDPHDSSAGEKMDEIDKTLKNVITKNDYDSAWCYEALVEALFKSNGGSPPSRGQQNTGHGGDFSTTRKPASPQKNTVVKWKGPGYANTGEKIIAMIPRASTVYAIEEDGRFGPMKKGIKPWQFITKDETTNLIYLVPASSVGNRAIDGYLSLPKDQIIDARYSEKLVDRADAAEFESLIDFAANPFQTRSSDSPRHPNGYGLVLFKNGTEMVLSRTALRKMLGDTDGDFEIQECEKRNGKISAWRFEPLEYREPRKMVIEQPSKARRRREALMRGDQSDEQGLFVPKDRTVKIPKERRGRTNSRSTAHSAKNGGRSVSRTSVTAEEVAGRIRMEMEKEVAGMRMEMQNEVAGMRNDMQDLKEMFRQMMVK